MTDRRHGRSELRCFGRVCGAVKVSNCYFRGLRRPTNHKRTPRRLPRLTMRAVSAQRSLFAMKTNPRGFH